MQIVIDARLILNQTTGIGNYLTNLINALLKIDLENHYTLLLNEKLDSNHPVDLLEQKNLTKRRIKTSAVSLKQHIAIPLQLWKENANIYHYPHFDLPLLQRCNSVITIHDLKYIIAPSFFPEFSISKKLYMSLSIRSSVKRARKVIVVSESTKEDLMRLFGVPAPKISVVPLAVGKRFAVSLNKEEIKIKLKKKGIHGKYFLFVGERRPHKNIVRLIEAFKIFKDRNSEKYQLVIVGKRYSNYTVPEQKIKELDLESNVIMVGYVPDEELPLYYQGAEMLVFPSMYEGFGIPILEAMACGIPVITSNISSMPEVAGNAAVLVNPYETNEIAAAMQRICSNRDLRKDLIAKGSKNVKRFSWEKTAEKTLSVYEESYMDGRK